MSEPTAPDQASPADADGAAATSSPAGAGTPGRPGSVRIAVIVSLALLAGFVAWIVIDRMGDDSPAGAGTTAAATTAAGTTAPATSGPAATANPIGPKIVPLETLSALVEQLDHPVYWAGPIPGRRYEYTLTSTGRAYVRYLPVGVAAGDPRTAFLIVATYPFPKAYTALEQVAKGEEIEIPGGGIALVEPTYPQSVHFAFPGIDYQGEVYHASPARSLEVATSGDVQPVP